MSLTTIILFSFFLQLQTTILSPAAQESTTPETTMLTELDESFDSDETISYEDMHLYERCVRNPHELITKHFNIVSEKIINFILIKIHVDMAEYQTLKHLPSLCAWLIIRLCLFEKILACYGHNELFIKEAHQNKFGAWVTSLIIKCLISNKTIIEKMIQQPQYVESIIEELSRIQILLQHSANTSLALSAPYLKVIPLEELLNNSHKKCGEIMEILNNKVRKEVFEKVMDAAEKKNPALYQAAYNEMEVALPNHETIIEKFRRNHGEILFFLEEIFSQSMPKESRPSHESIYDACISIIRMHRSMRGWNVLYSEAEFFDYCAALTQNAKISQCTSPIIKKLLERIHFKRNKLLTPHYKSSGNTSFSSVTPEQEK